MIKQKLLIWKYNRGSKDILRRIYEKYKDEMVTLAAALLNDKSAAEDVVHEVFTYLIKSCGRLRVSSSLKGYLTTSVANRARNINKSAHKRLSVPLDKLQESSSPKSGPDDAMVFNEDVRKLLSSLARLPYEQREVILLHIYSGLKFRKIGESQGVSVNTVQGRYRYGMSKLRSSMDGEVEK